MGTPAPSTNTISGLINALTADGNLINSSYSPEIQNYLTVVDGWGPLINDIQTHTNVLTSYGNLVDSRSVDVINTLITKLTDTKNTMNQTINDIKSDMSVTYDSILFTKGGLMPLLPIPSIPADTYTKAASQVSTIHTNVLNIRKSLDDIKNKVTNPDVSMFISDMMSWQTLFQLTIKTMASFILNSYMVDPTLTEMKNILDTHTIPDDLVDYSRSIDIVITESNNTMILNYNTITDTNFSSYMNYINYIKSSLTSVDNYHTKYGSNKAIRTLILTPPAPIATPIPTSIPSPASEPAPTTSVASSSETISVPVSVSTPSQSSPYPATAPTAPTTAPSQSSPYKQPLSQDGPPDYTMSDTTKMMIIAAIILVVLAALSMICIGFVMGGSATGNASATADSTEL